LFFVWFFIEELTENGIENLEVCFFTSGRVGRGGGGC